MSAQTTEHVHGCLNCRPDMVPDFDKDDPRYHDSQKCANHRSHGPAVVNGAPVSYTRGVFEGTEGWALFCGATSGDVHSCPTCEPDGRLQHICVEPRFGCVEIACPARGEV
jgi:hypothetical protein